MFDKTRKVAMLADVNKSHSAISSIYQCVVMSLRHSLWMCLTLNGQQNINGVDELRCQFINYYNIL